MALTILEASKLNSGDTLQAAIVEMYAKSSALLLALPFVDIDGASLTYNREQTLPGIGFRGVNEAYTESTGILNPVTELLAIAGGDLDVDKFLIQTRGARIRAVHEQMKVKALALRWTEAFIKGDSASNPREFDGLQTRITGNQLVNNNAGAAGAALSLFQLDTMISKVVDPTHLLMNDTLRLRLSQAARDTAVAGNINYVKDEFGRTVTQYNGLPIVVVEEDNDGNEILPFTEASATGAAALCTSIYCVNLSEGYLYGIQNGAMRVDDLGEVQAQPVMRTRVEWYSAIAAEHGRCAARLRAITNAAVTV
jgi:hypothetical protein